MTATVVLVHGAFSGSWTWRDVRKALDDAGIPNTAVDLPSCNRNDPAVGLRDDGKHVREAVEQIGGPVVLVGNSYGGAVITEAANDNAFVKRLVYLAAIPPRADEPLMQQLQSATGPGFDEALTFREDGLIEFDDEADRELAYQQAPPDQVEWIKANPNKPMSFGTDPNLTVSGEAWRTVPSTYVICDDDRSIRPEVQREWAKERATDFVEWPSDHCPQHSHPAEVAELLVRLVRENG